MAESSSSEEWSRLVSVEDVVGFEESLEETSNHTVICGPYTWKIHVDLSTELDWPNPILQVFKSIKYHDDGKIEIETQDEDIFTFARLLQFIYYGTYSHKADDPIPANSNLGRSGFPGLSPAAIVQLGLHNHLDDTTYTTAKSADDTTSSTFGHEIHLCLSMLAKKYYKLDLEELALERYSTFPFKNHREFYHSIVNRWSEFPKIDERQHGRSYIYGFIVPHLGRFWQEARVAARDEHRREARGMVRWVTAGQIVNRELVVVLLDEMSKGRLEKEGY